MQGRRDRFLARCCLLLLGGAVGPLVAPAATVGVSTPSFEERTGASNPFDGISGIATNAAPALVDIDADLDLDLFLGDESGSGSGEEGAPLYFYNDGGVRAAVFVRRTGSGNPFYPFTNVANPDEKLAFVPQLHGNGISHDVLIGQSDGQLTYLANVDPSEPDFPKFDGGSRSSHFTGVDVGRLAAPAFADLDGDGDLDVVVGTRAGTLRYFEDVTILPLIVNKYEARLGAASPFSGLDVGSRAVPTLGDLDGDGDLDLVVGHRTGVSYFDNVGSPTQPEFIQRSDVDHPFSGVSFFKNLVPALGDIDGDGDLDLVTGNETGGLRFFENTTPPFSPLEPVVGAGNPFDGIDLGDFPDPALADLDGDGDLDAAIGVGDHVRYLENVGDPSDPSFLLLTGDADPFVDVIGVSHLASPAFGDVDGDGDLDLLVGGRFNTLPFYWNEGDRFAPRFVRASSASDPFAEASNVSIDGEAALNLTPELVDIDRDGDLDLFLGEEGGTVLFFENVGTPTSPSYAQRTRDQNPFDWVDVAELFLPVIVVNECSAGSCFATVDVGHDVASAFGDFDFDGRVDAALGDLSGRLLHFRNKGSAPTRFEHATGARSPFNGVLTYAGLFNFSVSRPAFGDVDGDRDLDLVLGSRDGELFYYRNDSTALVFTDGFESGDSSRWSSVVASNLDVNTSADCAGTWGLHVGVGSNCSDPADVNTSGPGVNANLSACETIAAQDGQVTGTKTYTAGKSIALGNGFSVVSGASFTAVIDPSRTSPHGFVQDNSPAAETHYRASFQIRLDGLALDDGDTFDHFVAYDGGGVPWLWVRLHRNPPTDERRIIVAAREDGGSEQSTVGSEISVSSGCHVVEVEWLAASAPGAHNGSVGISLDGTPHVGLSGLDNDQGQIDFVRWGAVSGVDASDGCQAGGSLPDPPCGTLDLDDFNSWRN